MISVYFIHSHISFRFSLQVAGCVFGWGHEISRKKILEFSFPVPDLKMGETYKFDIRISRLGEAGSFYLYFQGFFILMEEGTAGTIKVGQD
jgi:hypothetical protein